MKHSYNLVYADFYNNYIQLVLDADINKVLKKNNKKFIGLLESIPVSKIGWSYAEGKWTVKQLVQHVIDAERVFSYRAMRIARFDPAPMPGFDENSWADKADVSVRSWKDMISEFMLLRKSNMLMIADFSKEQLDATGTASENPVSTAALCFIIAGHAQHHMNILKERYLQK